MRRRQSRSRSDACSSASLLLSRWIRRHLPHESHVGLLLPASVGGALANIALSLAGRVPVNLNFTAGRESMDVAIAKCGIKTILTSRKFLAKADIEPLDGMVFLEDVMKEFSAAAKRAHAADGLPAAGLALEPALRRSGPTPTSRPP